MTLELMNAAERICQEIVGVKKKDKILVVTDAPKLTVGKTFSLVCRGIGAETVLAVMPLLKQHGNEPPMTIAAAMAAADVVFTVTTYAITHTKARRNAHAAGVRVVILRGVDEEMMIKGAMCIDPKKIRKITSKVAVALKGSSTIRVTTPSGTDVTFSVKGRRFFTLDGYFQEDMGFAALPGGECPTSPLEETAFGTIVVDYSMDGLGRLKQPLILQVEAGRVSSIEGTPEERSIILDIFKKDPNARNLAEFSIGTNPGARLIGNLAEDKKALGTVHFALGDNKSLGGAVNASVHLDALVLNPTVIADERRVIVDKGRLVI